MNIFYLEWINKRPTICEFRNTIPDNYNFRCSVNIRKYNDIFSEIKLYGLIGDQLTDYKFINSPF